MKCYRKDYPRPQFVRENWENLNGRWEFRFDDGNVGESEKWYDNFCKELEIEVPFTYETKLSGIQDESHHNHIWYHRTIQVDGEKIEHNNYVIHFEGSDFLTKLWVNGQYAGSHKGGYARFSFDITGLVRAGINTLTVKVEDSCDAQQPRGKQRWFEKSFGIWYVQTTGIWKTVWSEYVPKTSLSYVKMTPNLDDNCMELEAEISASEESLGDDLMLEVQVSFQGQLINRSVTAFIMPHIETCIDLSANTFDLSQMPQITWTPGNPHLYDVVFRVVKGQAVLDEVGSYFAMREIKIEGSNILLNGRPLYQRLVLDQGYWKDSHLTAPNEEALIEDIEKIQAMGYNGVRKHQKVEDERFLYWCDVKGMLVWSEMAAAHRYSDYAVTEFTVEWMEILKQNYNHPCIITWTPFNESWGISKIRTRRDQQHFTEAIYHLTKSMDKMRPVIVNDGWEHTISDILTLHDYESFGGHLKKRYTECKDALLNSQIAYNKNEFSFANGYGYRGQPVVISEFGGIAFRGEGAGWGYGNKVCSCEEFIKRFDSITSAIKELPYVCGYCYTQVTDVWQEMNGLMDSERNFKIAPEIIQEINLRQAGHQ